MAWLCLALAGILEIIWLITATYSKGFTDLKWTAITLACLPVSLWLFTQSLKVVPVGTAYAVWTGIGAAGGAAAGIIIFHEAASAVRLSCIGGIILCIVILKMTSPAGH